MFKNKRKSHDDGDMAFDQVSPAKRVNNFGHSQFTHKKRQLEVDEVIDGLVTGLSLSDEPKRKKVRDMPAYYDNSIECSIGDMTDVENNVEERSLESVLRLLPPHDAPENLHVKLAPGFVDVYSDVLPARSILETNNTYPVIVYESTVDSLKKSARSSTSSSIPLLSASEDSDDSDADIEYSPHLRPQQPGERKKTFPMLHREYSESVWNDDFDDSCSSSQYSRITPRKSRVLIEEIFDESDDDQVMLNGHSINL